MDSFFSVLFSFSVFSLKHWLSVCIVGSEVSVKRLVRDVAVNTLAVPLDLGHPVIWQMFAWDQLALFTWKVTQLSSESVCWREVTHHGRWNPLEQETHFLVLTKSPFQQRDSVSWLGAVYEGTRPHCDHSFVADDTNEGVLWIGLVSRVKVKLPDRTLVH